MFIPKPVLFILFLVAITSTGGVLYLLSSRVIALPSQPSASTTVLVMSTAQPTSTPLPSASDAASLSSNAEWKTATVSAMNFKLDYPKNWTTSATDSAEFTMSAQNDGPTILSVTRQKKATSSQKIGSVVTEREELMKKMSYVMKEEKNTTVDDYPAVERIYVLKDTSKREILFSTKNFFYIVVVSTSSSEYDAVIQEIIKSIKIV